MTSWGIQVSRAKFRALTSILLEINAGKRCPLAPWAERCLGIRVRTAMSRVGPLSRQEIEQLLIRCGVRPNPGPVTNGTELSVTTPSSCQLIRCLLLRSGVEPNPGPGTFEPKCCPLAGQQVADVQVITIDRKSPIKPNRTIPTKVCAFCHSKLRHLKSDPKSPYYHDHYDALAELMSGNTSTRAKRSLLDRTQTIRVKPCTEPGSSREHALGAEIELQPMKRNAPTLLLPPGASLKSSYANSDNDQPSWNQHVRDRPVVPADALYNAKAVADARRASAAALRDATLHSIDINGTRYIHMDPDDPAWDPDVKRPRPPAVRAHVPNNMEVNPEPPTHLGPREVLTTDYAPPARDNVLDGHRLDDIDERNVLSELTGWPSWCFLWQSPIATWDYAQRRATYQGDHRIVFNRNVNVTAVDAVEARLQVYMPLTPWTSAFNLVFLGLTVVAMALMPWWVILLTASATLIPYRYHVPNLLTVTYWPHIVANICPEFERCTDFATLNGSIRMKIRRLATLPIDDVDHLCIVQGSELVVRALCRNKPNFCSATRCWRELDDCSSQLGYHVFTPWGPELRRCCNTYLSQTARNVRALMTATPTTNPLLCACLRIACRALRCSVSCLTAISRVSPLSAAILRTPIRCSKDLESACSGTCPSRKPPASTQLPV